MLYLRYDLYLVVKETMNRAYAGGGRKKGIRIAIAVVITALVLILAIIAVVVVFIGGQNNETMTYAYLPDHSVYFYDVSDKYAWAHREVDVLSLAGIIRGGGEHLFYPEKAIGRADFIMMLDRTYKMSEALENGTVESKGAFVDVLSSDYFYNSVVAAKALGVAGGASGNHFWPKQVVSRQEAMVLLKRTLDCTDVKLPSASLSGFSDKEKISEFAEEAVSALTGAGIVDGSGGKLNPDATISRAEIAVMLYRATHLVEGEGGSKYEKNGNVMNVCIGANIYTDAVIENYNPDAVYSKLMRYTSIRQENDITYIKLEESQSIDCRASVSGGQIVIENDKYGTRALPLSGDCVAIDVTAPYHQMSAPVSTGGTYRHCYPSVTNGKVNIIYYTTD